MLRIPFLSTVSELARILLCLPKEVRFLKTRLRILSEAATYGVHQNDISCMAELTPPPLSYLAYAIIESGGGLIRAYNLRSLRSVNCALIKEAGLLSSKYFPPISFGNPAIPSVTGGDPLSFAPLISLMSRVSYYREMVINTFINFLERTEKK